MIFYLGTHHPHWLERTDAPLFVSRRWLADRKRLPRARGRWALDSGGFTELSTYGEWRVTEGQYIAEVERFRAEIGRVDWVAPMDWMCEPGIIHGDPGRGWPGTHLSVAEHQRRTVENFLGLRDALGGLVIPVLQGWELDDYLRCWDLYHQHGVELEWEDTIGLGSVCRRQNTSEAGVIVRSLADRLLGRQLHAFGIKITGLKSFGDCLSSADSMAWSYDARYTKPAPRGDASCAAKHRRCNNCLTYALKWRDQVHRGLSQLRLAVA